MIEIQAPNSFCRYSSNKYFTLFLGGSIEMGKAKPWQKKVVTAFEHYHDAVILNPRRNDWDSSWEQVKTNPKFRQQVEWELDALEFAENIIIYFDPGTQSPISLLELGLFKEKKPLIICPEGFWRKGNVDIVCEKYEIPQFDDLDTAIDYLKESIA